MTEAVHLDWETGSEVNLKESGMWRYAEDPSTHILIAAFSIGDGPVVGVDMTEAEVLGPPPALHPLFEAIHRGAPLCAHNAQFERNIWEKVGHYLPITPHENQWDCTAARARALAIPGSLDGAAEALGVDNRKDPRGLVLINMFCKPQKDGSWILPTDRPKEFLEFIEYCRQDVVVERDLDRVLPPLSDVEKKAWLLDWRINDRGMPVNMEMVHRADDFVQEHSAKLMKRAFEISGCRPTQRVKTMDFFESRGFKLPNLQAATVEAFAKRKGVPKDLAELVDLRIEVSRAGTKKLKAIKATVSADDRIRGGFLFSAASTRRWSSTGVQLHNLQKPEGEVNPEALFQLLMADEADLIPDLFDRPLTAIAQSIRGFLEAPKNRVLNIADYASIEPRGLCWMANEEWLLRAYHNDEDAYKIMASKVYNIPASSIMKGSKERDLGKQLILGGGYGMGPPRFIETCAKFGIVIDLPDSQKAIYGYRASVPKILQFWKSCEAACIRAVRSGNTIRIGKLQFRPATLVNGFEVLYVDMPSGTICYPKPNLGSSMWNGMPTSRFQFYTPLGSSWIETDTFGGSIVENIIQALARDVLRDGLLSADLAGHYVIGHVHDEGISEGDGHPGELEDFERHLVSSSSWSGKGLMAFPIAVEGFRSKRYKK